MSSADDTTVKASVSGRLRTAVVAVGWLGLFLLVSPVVGGAVALCVYLVRVAWFAPVASPGLGFVDDQMLLAGVIALLALLVYGLIRWSHLLKLATFGERAVEESREETAESIDQAADAADTAQQQFDQE